MEFSKAQWSFSESSSPNGLWGQGENSKKTQKTGYATERTHATQGSEQ